MIAVNDAAKWTLSPVVVPVTCNSGGQYAGVALVNVGGQSRKAMADPIMAADKSRRRTPPVALSKSDMLAVEDALEVHLVLPRGGSTVNHQV